MAIICFEAIELKAAPKGNPTNDSYRNQKSSFLHAAQFTALKLRFRIKRNSSSEQ